MNKLDILSFNLIGIWWHNIDYCIICYMVNPKLALKAKNRSF